MMCARAENAKKPISTHNCYKNWTGSSSAMEAAVILEGFQRSEELYGIRYNRIIADGDSSVYKTLVSNRPYKSTCIEKVECTNHLLRNLCKKVRAVGDTKGLGTGSLRKMVNGKVKKMRGAVNKASKHWAEQQGPLEKRIVQLAKDIRNAPQHTFGHHDNCSSYFCKGSKPNEIDFLENLKTSGIWPKLEEAFTFLARQAKSLIQRMDSNLAENFNSQVAKFIGKHDSLKNYRRREW